MDPGFLLKKTISLFLDPVAWPLLAMLLAGAVSVAPRWSEKHFGSIRRRRICRRIAIALAWLGWGSLYLASIAPVSRGLTSHLERKCPPPLPEGALPEGLRTPEFVVVLAGGQRAAEGKPALSSLTRHALARVVGGVDLWKRFPDSRLVFTGVRLETESMTAVAARLGVPVEMIIQESESRDTDDHPRLLEPILGDAPFLLVTSATHFPRSLALFQGRGLDPIPAPVDFTGWPEDEPSESGYRPSLVPAASNVYRTSIALHEIHGMAWAKLTGKAD